MRQAGKSNIFKDNVPLYRGEVRSSSDFNNLSEGDTYSSPAFLSGSKDEMTARGFMPDSEDLDEGQINVFYTIENINPYSGALLSKLINHAEDEFLFLPDVKFTVINKSYDEAEKELAIVMRQNDIPEDAFRSRLYELIKGARFRGDAPTVGDVPEGDLRKGLHELGFTPD
jgi:hypothetical protein